MTTAAHTPGPWTLEEKPGQLNSIYARGKVISGVVAQVNAGWPGAEQKAEQLSNARLIAAAPDMLQALRRAVLALAFAAESSEAMRDDYNAVSAAISKATGAAG